MIVSYRLYLPYRRYLGADSASQLMTQSTLFCFTSSSMSPEVHQPAFSCVIMKRTRRHCNPVSYAESDVDDSDASFAEATPPPPKRPRSSRSSHVTTNAEKHSSEARPRPSRKTQTTKRAKVVIVRMSRHAPLKTS